MIEKRERCLYCNQKMESKTAKRKFCSNKCKTYYRRELIRGTLTIHKPEPVEPDAEVEAHNEKIYEQIRAINQEPKPSHATTAIGIQGWKFDQGKRIEYLKRQLK